MKGSVMEQKKEGASDAPEMAWPKCAVCDEMLTDEKSLLSHKERHSPVEKEEPGSAPCPKGCGRPFLRPNDMAKHSEHCGGEPPLTSSGDVVTVARPTEEPVRESSGETSGKEEDVGAKCKICGKAFKSGKGLGGHMSKSHPGKAKELAKEPKPEKEAAKAAKAAKPRRAKKGRKPARAARTAPVRTYHRRAAAAPAAAAGTDGILDKLQAKADWHRTRAQEIQDQIAAFRESAQKFL